MAGKSDISYFSKGKMGILNNFFCRVVGTIYTLLYMLLLWLSDTVVDQELCVSSFTGARHTYRGCASPPVKTPPGLADLH